MSKERSLRGSRREKQYDREFHRFKRRVDRINQSVLTVKEIELKRARITCRVREEEIKRAEALTSRNLNSR